MNGYALAWTLTAVVGAVLSSVLLYEAVLDWQSLSGNRNGRMWRVLGRGGSEVLRLSVHIPFAIVGIGALDEPTNPEAIGTILVLLWGNVVLILNSILQIVVRRRAEPLSADEAAALVIAQAEVAARKVKAVARDAAERLTSDSDAVVRVADATERQADATERIADK